MKFISIVKKEILHNIKDKKAMFLMTVFPIILILILGTAFSQSFESISLVSKVKVAYMAEDKNGVYNNFKEFKDDISKSLSIDFTEVNDKDKALKDVSHGSYDCLINIKNEKSIEIYNNNIRRFNGNLVKTVMQSFVDRTNLIMEVAKVDSSNIYKLVSNKDPKYVQVSSIEQKKGPTAKDYYAVTMFTMIILYSTNIGGFSILGERMKKTYERIMCSSVTKFQYLFAKVVGAFLVTSFQVGIVYFFSRYVIRTNWGDHPQYILVISASLIFMAVSVGVGLSSGITNPMVMAAALNLTIPVFVFLAGGYVPLSEFSSNLLYTLSNISPLKWTNEAMFNIIYNNDLSTVPTAVSINMVIGVIFILISLMNTARKDVI